MFFFFFFFQENNIQIYFLFFYFFTVLVLCSTPEIIIVYLAYQKLTDIYWVGNIVCYSLSIKILTPISRYPFCFIVLIDIGKNHYWVKLNTEVTGGYGVVLNRSICSTYLLGFRKVTQKQSGCVTWRQGYFQLRKLNGNLMLGETKKKQQQKSKTNWLNSPTLDFYGLSETSLGFSLKSIKLSVC